MLLRDSAHGASNPFEFLEELREIHTEYCRYPSSAAKKVLEFHRVIDLREEVFILLETFESSNPAQFSNAHGDLARSSGVRFWLMLHLGHETRDQSFLEVVATRFTAPFLHLW